ncbi:hypothetical protein GF377_05445 [candidate division GN15 bacterium]|nr:hypothetical protein [candidate division GN15 bacterium]
MQTAAAQATPAAGPRMRQAVPYMGQQTGRHNAHRSPTNPKSNQPPMSGAIKESALATDLNELVHTAVRELAMACRKMAIYGADHPQSIKAVEKPFFALSDLFRFKTLLTINVYQGHLYFSNVRLKDTVFNGQIMQFLQALDISAVFIERRMTIKELTVFIENLVRRDIGHENAQQLADHLQRLGIVSIELNSERAFDLLERRRQYRGDVAGDFSVRRMVLDQLTDDVDRVAAAYVANADQLIDLQIDFDMGVVRYLSPEGLMAIDWSRIRQYLEDLARDIRTAQTEARDASDKTARYMAVFKLVEFHPSRDRILADLDDIQIGKRGSDEDPNSATGQIRLQSSQRMEDYLRAVFADDSPACDTREFGDHFARLLKTGQKDRAVEVVELLLDHMSDPEAGSRSKGLALSLAAVAELRFDSDSMVTHATVLSVQSRLGEGRETFEYSEFLSLLFEQCLNDGHLDLAAKLCLAMAARRTPVDTVTVYDSIAVKKAFENIARGEIVDRLISDLICANHEQAGHLKDILVSIGTEIVALALSKIISHPVRTIRQLTLRILADMGKAALTVFSNKLLDDSLFERESGRHELPNEQWYIIRNSIFVLGSLHDPQAVPALRVRLSDTDVRVRREIVAALEKIGGEEAVDCLALMADDYDREIREAAIIAIGLVGQPVDAPVLIDLASRHARESVRAVAALGKLGGDEARTFLADLLHDSQRLAEIADGKVSKDDLRLAAVRALGAIGDRESLVAIHRFKDAQSGTARIFFKNSALNKVIEEIISRH